MTDINPADIPAQPAPAQPKTMLGDKAYAIAKSAALIWLPAVATLYTALGGIWGFPNVQQVVGTIVAVDTFLGIVLKISTTNYNNSDAPYDGNLNVHTDENGNKKVDLVLNDDPYGIDQKANVNFKVVPTSDPPANPPAVAPPHTPDVPPADAPPVPG